MFQLSLSTSLTPLATPGAGVSPAPTAAFTVALAGASEAIDAPPAIATTATAPRQAPAETGKALPIAADTSDVLAWLDAGETQASGRPIERGTLPAKQGASPVAQTVDSKPGQPIDPNATVRSTTVAGETSVTPGAADVPASTPAFPKKTAADRTDTKAPKHHDHAASRAEPDSTPIILVANAPSAAVVAAPPPTDISTAVPTSPKAAPSPIITAPVSGHGSTIRGHAPAALSAASPSDAKPFNVKAIADDDLPPVLTIDGVTAPGSAQAPAPIAEPTTAPDIAGNGVLALPVDGSERQAVSDKRSLAPQPTTPAPVTAPSSAPVAPLAAHDAAPVIPSPAPESVTVGSSTTSEAMPIVEHRALPATDAPAIVDTKFQAPASPAKSEDRRDSVIVRAEHAIAAAVRDSDARAPATMPASASVAAISSPPAAAALSPKQPPEPVSPAVLATATGDTAPVAHPALQTRQSAAIDLAPASPAVATATDSRAAPVAAPPVAQAPLQSAGMMFGIALGPPTLDRRPADRSSPRDEALQALSSLAATGSAAPIAAAGDAQQGTLDMHRDDWPQAMIDRIEALRDAADATSTRITLAPDALGKVDLSIRHDGDAVHVHFAAETAQTRAILADAQPKLAELAQARGLRLGQATVDAGAGGQGQRQQPTATPAQPQRPASAFTRAAADDSAAATDSTRLA